MSLSNALLCLTALILACALCAIWLEIADIRKYLLSLGLDKEKPATPEEETRA